MSLKNVSLVTKISEYYIQFVIYYRLKSPPVILRQLWNFRPPSVELCCRDDEWFYISHPCHLCSAKELISAFPQSGKGCTNLDLCGQEQFSPRLPRSVSRSRGKDYRSREWGQNS